MRKLATITFVMPFVIYLMYNLKYFSSFVSFLSSLDPEQKDYLIEVIEKLLKDKTTVRNAGFTTSHENCGLSFWLKFV